MDPTTQQVRVSRRAGNLESVEDVVRGAERIETPSATTAADQTVLTVIVRDQNEGDEVRALLSAAMPLLRDRGERVQDVIDALLPPEGILDRGAMAQSRRNAVLRDQIAREHGLLGATDVATLAGSKATNPSATATRWRQAGRIFSVAVGTAQLYPGFQFTGTGPIPQVATLIEILGHHLQGWQLAAWMTQPLVDLDGLTPLEAWDDNLDGVVEAARYEASRLAG